MDFNSDNMQRFCEVVKGHNINVNKVLEIGSRDGDDAAYMAQSFGVPSSMVWLCEPNPAQAQVIRNKYPDFNLIDKAIFDKAGTLDFLQMHGSPPEIGTSSLMPRSLDNLYDRATRIQVEAITGQDLLAMIPGEIGACKVDVEGATYQVLKSMGDDLKRIKAFHLECEHVEVWTNQEQYNSIASFMIEMGYEQVDFQYVIGTIQSDSIWIKL
jgi:FkbM family methyltransferase